MDPETRSHAFAPTELGAKEISFLMAKACG